MPTATRNSTTRPLTRLQWLALAELAHKAGGSARKVAVASAALADHHARRLVAEGLIEIAPGEGDHANAVAHVSAAGLQRLEARGLLRSDIAGVREWLKFPPGYGRRNYRTAWLNDAEAA